MDSTRIVFYFVTLCSSLLLCYAAPIPNYGHLPFELSQAFSGPVIIFVSIGFLLACGFVLFGCTCCVRKDIQDTGRPTQQPNESGCSVLQNGSEFTIFPPCSSVINMQPVSLFANEPDKVVFEPLPDILPKKNINGQNFAQSSKPAHFSALLRKKSSLHDWFDDPSSNFPRNQLQYLQELGSGWFGRVVEGEAQMIIDGQEKTPVVVKILREEATPSEHLYFLHDVRPYRDLQHPNVLRMLGRCLETDPFLLIMEHSSENLKSYLLKQRDCGMKNEVVTHEEILQMACDVTAGLLYMHEHDFPHSDLAAHNCFLSMSGVVKVGDYGLSLELFSEDYYCIEDLILPIRWLAPEMFNYSDKVIETPDATKTSNIWSLGVTLWEIVELCKLPYFELSDEEVLQKVIIEKSVILEEPVSSHPYNIQMYQIMQLCCRPANCRPDVQVINMLLKQLNQSRASTESFLLFEQKWNSLQNKTPSPHYVVPLKFENDFVSSSSETHGLESFHESSECHHSPSLRGLNGSFDELQMNDESCSDVVTPEQITEAIRDFDEMLASEAMILGVDSQCATLEHPNHYKTAHRNSDLEDTILKDESLEFQITEESAKENHVISDSTHPSVHSAVQLPDILELSQSGNSHSSYGIDQIVDMKDNSDSLDEDNPDNESSFMTDSPSHITSTPKISDKKVTADKDANFGILADSSDTDKYHSCSIDTSLSYTTAPLETTSINILNEQAFVSAINNTMIQKDNEETITRSLSDNFVSAMSNLKSDTFVNDDSHATENCCSTLENSPVSEKLGVDSQTEDSFNEHITLCEETDHNSVHDNDVNANSFNSRDTTDPLDIESDDHRSSLEDINLTAEEKIFLQNLPYKCTNLAQLKSFYDIEESPIRDSFQYPAWSNVTKDGLFSRESTDSPDLKSTRDCDLNNDMSSVVSDSFVFLKSKEDHQEINQGTIYAWNDHDKIIVSDLSDIAEVESENSTPYRNLGIDNPIYDDEMSSVNIMGENRGPRRMNHQNPCESLSAEEYDEDDEDDQLEQDEVLKIDIETNEAILVDTSESLIGFVPSRSIELLQEFDCIASQLESSANIGSSSNHLCNGTILENEENDYGSRYAENGMSSDDGLDSESDRLEDGEVEQHQTKSDFSLSPTSEGASYSDHVSSPQNHNDENANFDVYNDVVLSNQPTKSVIWHSDETLDILDDKEKKIVIEGDEIMAGLDNGFKDTIEFGSRDFLDRLVVSASPVSNCSVASTPCRDVVYTPDFESESEESSQSSCSSTSGSFECIHNKFKNVNDISAASSKKEDSPIVEEVEEESSPMKVFSKTWDCHATPNKGLLRSPEKKVVPIRKSVSFHEDPQLVFQYPPASDSSDEEASSGTDFLRRVDFTSYADWEMHISEDDDIPEEMIEIEELEYEPYNRGFGYRGISVCPYSGTSQYTLTGFSEEDLDVLDTGTVSQFSAVAQSAKGPSERFVKVDQIYNKSPGDNKSPEIQDPQQIDGVDQKNDYDSSSTPLVLDSAVVDNLLIPVDKNVTSVLNGDKEIWTSLPDILSHEISTCCDTMKTTNLIETYITSNNDIKNTESQELSCNDHNSDSSSAVCDEATTASLNIVDDCNLSTSGNRLIVSDTVTEFVDVNEVNDPNSFCDESVELLKSKSDIFDTGDGEDENNSLYSSRSLNERAEESVMVNSSLLEFCDKILFDNETKETEISEALTDKSLDPIICPATDGGAVQRHKASIDVSITKTHTLLNVLSSEDQTIDSRKESVQKVTPITLDLLPKNENVKVSNEIDSDAVDSETDYRPVDSCIQDNMIDLLPKSICSNADRTSEFLQQNITNTSCLSNVGEDNDKPLCDKPQSKTSDENLQWNNMNVKRDNGIVNTIKSREPTDLFMSDLVLPNEDNTSGLLQHTTSINPAEISCDNNIATRDDLFAFDLVPQSDNRSSPIVLHQNVESCSSIDSFNHLNNDQPVNNNLPTFNSEPQSDFDRSTDATNSDDGNISIDGEDNKANHDGLSALDLVLQCNDIKQSITNTNNDISIIVDNNKPTQFDLLPNLSNMGINDRNCDMVLQWNSTDSCGIEVPIGISNSIDSGKPSHNKCDSIPQSHDNASVEETNTSVQENIANSTSLGMTADFASSSKGTDQDASLAANVSLQKDDVKENRVIDTILNDDFLLKKHGDHNPEASCGTSVKTNNTLTIPSILITEADDHSSSQNELQEFLSEHLKLYKSQEDTFEVTVDFSDRPFEDELNSNNSSYP